MRDIFQESLSGLSHVRLTQFTSDLVQIRIEIMDTTLPRTDIAHLRIMT